MNVMRVLLGLLLALSLAALAGCQASSEPSNQHITSTPASESHLAFRSDSRLQDHFEKHGREVGCATPEEYVACANAVICDPDALHKTQREDGDDAYFLESTGEFVVVSQQGYIRTYFITDKAYFDKQ